MTTNTSMTMSLIQSVFWNNTKMKLLILLLALIPIVVCARTRGFKRVCYFASWAMVRKYEGAKMMIEDIDPFLCTHVVYAFAKINFYKQKLEGLEWNDESTPKLKGNFEKFNELKIKNPALKTLVSIGGAKLGSHPFNEIVSEANRWIFVQNAVQTLREWGFDGLDVDWEYPGLPERGTDEETRYQFSDFMKEMSEAFTAESRATGLPRLLLTAAVGVGEKHIKGSYVVPKLAKSVDWLNLMLYDLHGGWDRFAGGNGPLYPRTSNFRFNKKLSAEWVVNKWIRSGTPAYKLVLGVPAQGRTFNLINASDHFVGSPTLGHGPPGPIINEKGIMAFIELCVLMKEGGKVGWDDEQAFPYLYKDNLWAGFDNARSVAIKMAWLIRRRLGGAMIWSLDQDDFSGEFCNRGPFPLTTTMKKMLESRRVPAERAYLSGTDRVKVTWRLQMLISCLLVCTLSLL